MSGVLEGDVIALVGLHADLRTGARDAMAGARACRRVGDHAMGNAEAGRADVLDRQADALEAVLAAIRAPVHIPAPGQLSLLGMGTDR